MSSSGAPGAAGAKVYITDLENRLRTAPRYLETLKRNTNCLNEIITKYQKCFGRKMLYPFEYVKNSGYYRETK